MWNDHRQGEGLVSRRAWLRGGLGGLGAAVALTIPGFSRRALGQSGGGGVPWPWPPITGGMYCPFFPIGGGGGSYYYMGTHCPMPMSQIVMVFPVPIPNQYLGCGTTYCVPDGMTTPVPAPQPSPTPQPLPPAPARLCAEPEGPTILYGKDPRTGEDFLETGIKEPKDSKFTFQYVQDRVKVLKNFNCFDRAGKGKTLVRLTSLLVCPDGNPMSPAVFRMDVGEQVSGSAEGAIAGDFKPFRGKLAAIRPDDGSGITYWAMMARGPGREVVPVGRGNEGGRSSPPDSRR